jgi:hypothetical protein
MFSSGMQRCTLKSLGLTSLHRIGVQSESKTYILRTKSVNFFRRLGTNRTVSLASAIPVFLSLDKTNGHFDNASWACSPHQRGIRTVHESPEMVLRRQPIHRASVLLAQRWRGGACAAGAAAGLAGATSGSPFMKFHPHRCIRALKHPPSRAPLRDSYQSLLRTRIKQRRVHPSLPPHVLGIEASHIRAVETWARREKLSSGVLREHRDGCFGRPSPPPR